MKHFITSISNLFTKTVRLNGGSKPPPYNEIYSLLFIQYYFFFKPNGRFVNRPYKMGVGTDHP